MDAPRGQNQDEFASVGAFVNSLPSLKENGSALLVVGDVPSDVHAYASRQMLGLNQGENRRRLIILTDGDYTGAARRLSTGPSNIDDSTSIIAYDPHARSTSAGSIPGLENAQMRELFSANLTELGLATHEEIKQLEAGTTTLEPAGLRVCLSSIAPLLGENDAESVFRFLHLLSWRIKHSRGIVHVHLFHQKESSDVRLFEPLFDAVVELRIQGAEIQQRWRLTDGKGMSRWMVM